MRHNEKEQKYQVKGENYGFLPHIFPNLGHLECYTPLNVMCIWRFH